MGVTFANYYMCDLEKSIFDAEPDLKPVIYCRYIDDIYILKQSEYELPKLVDTLLRNSVLQFMSEQGHNHQLNFLDVNVTIQGDHFTTSV